MYSICMRGRLSLPLSQYMYSVFVKMQHHIHCLLFIQNNAVKICLNRKDKLKATCKNKVIKITIIESFIGTNVRKHETTSDWGTNKKDFNT